MRTARDRIRQAVSFEIIGLVIVTPLGAWLFGHDPFNIGLLAAMAATLATGWNYVYNLGFDHALLRLTGRVRKRPMERVLHALGFEGGLLVALLPIVALWLGISLWDAFVMDLFLALFYMIYAFVFTWIYERIFPVPEPAPQRA
ncbi:MAG: PACE efflux transporter [Rhodobacteraceae bacterium]|nr:PACE efflux transporter [Paracoccaceae bacterium]